MVYLLGAGKAGRPSSLLGSPAIDCTIMATYPQLEIADTETELVDMDSIQHHPDNPRYHSRQQIEELAASLGDHDYASISLTISKATRNIVKGNGMYNALQLCGCKQVRVVIKDMTPLQELQFLIRDNRLSELSDWDMPVLKANLATLGDEDIELEDVGFELQAIEEMRGWVEKPTEGDWAAAFEQNGDTSSVDDLKQVTFVLQSNIHEKLMKHLATYNTNKNVAIVEWLNQNML